MYCPRIPEDEISRVETRFLDFAASFFEPFHVLVFQLDMVVRIIGALSLANL